MPFSRPWPRDFRWSSTRVGGLPELIDEGRGGYLVSPAAVEELTEAVGRLVADRECARRMGQHNRRICLEKFSFSVVFESLSTIYDEIVSAKADGATSKPVSRPATKPRDGLRMPARGRAVRIPYRWVVLREQKTAGAAVSSSRDAGRSIPPSLRGRPLRSPAVPPVFHAAPSSHEGAAKLEALLFVHFHKIEKTLALPEPPPLFGTSSLGPLLDLLDAWEHSVGDFGAIPVRAALGALRRYRERVGQRLAQEFPELSSRLDRRLARHPEATGRSEDGGPSGSPRAHFRPEAAAIDFERFALLRHSVRNFSAESVPRELIARAVRTAQRTPSVCNRQAWRVHVYTSPEDKDVVLRTQDGNAGFGHLAASILLVSSDTRVYVSSGERHQAYVDGGMFAMSLVYALQAQGVASCCLNLCNYFFQDVAVHRACRIPAWETPIMMIAIGYPRCGIPGRRVRSARYGSCPLMALVVKPRGDTGRLRTPSAGLCFSLLPPSHGRRAPPHRSSASSESCGRCGPISASASCRTVRSWIAGRLRTLESTSSTRASIRIPAEIGAASDAREASEVYGPEPLQRTAAPVRVPVVGQSRRQPTRRRLRARPQRRLLSRSSGRLRGRTPRKSHGRPGRRRPVCPGLPVSRPVPTLQPAPRPVSAASEPSLVYIRENRTREILIRLGVREERLLQVPDVAFAFAGHHARPIWTGEALDAQPSSSPVGRALDQPSRSPAVRGSKTGNRYLEGWHDSRST